MATLNQLELQPNAVALPNTVALFAGLGLLVHDCNQQDPSNQLTAAVKAITIIITIWASLASEPIKGLWTLFESKN